MIMEWVDDFDNLSRQRHAVADNLPSTRPWRASRSREPIRDKALELVERDAARRHEIRGE